MFPLLRRLLVRRMAPVVDHIASELRAGRPTLVHCRQGRDRTGAVLAAVLVHQLEYTPDEAVRCVREANPQAMASSGFDNLPRLFAEMELQKR
jgi:protein-tyrosine phosphatase